jgi:hypothetical protein
MFEKYYCMVFNNFLKLEMDLIINKEKADYYKQMESIYLLNLAYAEREAGEIAYYQSCVDIILWENMIENVIYVQS